MNSSVCFSRLLFRLPHVAPLAGALFFVAAAWAAPATADTASLSASLTPPGGRISIEAQGVVAPVPVFFTAQVQQHLSVAATEIRDEATVAVRIVQGKPKVLSLGLVGEGEVIDVTGPGLHDWSVRRVATTGGEQRFLDLRVDRAAASNDTFQWTVRTRRTELAVPATLTPLLLTAGDAVALSWRASIEPTAGVDVRLTRMSGVARTEPTVDGSRAIELVGRNAPSFAVTVTALGGPTVPAELSQASLVGRFNAGEGSATFRFQARALVQRAGARLRVLSGRAAVSGQPAGDGWHLQVADPADGGYDLVFDRAGSVAVAFELVAPAREEGDWRRIEFVIRGAAVVPITVTGLATDAEFDPAAAVVLTAGAGGWQGFLPASGYMNVAWRRVQQARESALVFASTEKAEIRVAAGVLREAAQLTFRVTQGQLSQVPIRVDGTGDIVGVDGANVLRWSVGPDGGGRMLTVTLSRPIENEGHLVVQSQSVLGAFPARVEPLRLTPLGAVRHAGFVRVAAMGAVRLEVNDVRGLLQLEPAQFPGEPLEAAARQAFVYRFPAGPRSFTVTASQILPEVSVNEVTTYRLGDADRVIQSEVELEVREAPLRDWSILVPAEYAIAAVEGAEVGDYNAETASPDGTRALKVIFAQPVSGRGLVRVRLEQNQPPAAGEWALPRLQYPGAKAVRAHIGVAAVAGFRLVPAATAQLVELPLTVFPRQVAGLQQAFRAREARWSATLRIEPLPQSVQADVFHVYTLKEGGVSANVLLNYFVVGAPAAEWRIEVPANAGNIDVTGQGVRREWRREGNVLIVNLHQPVLGAATLLVTFEQPMGARGGILTPGDVRPLGVQAERGYVEVVSPILVKTEVTKAEGNILRLEPLELPTELRLLTSAPAVAVYQYTSRPFSLALNAAWYAAGEGVEEVVDFARFDSQVSRDGQVVTEAALLVKTRGRSVLRLQLPAGVKLWDVEVDRQRVTARTDRGWTLVPLAARQNPNEAVRVALRLGQAPLGSGHRVELTAPKLSVPVVAGEWRVRGDRGRLLVVNGGTATLTAPNLTERGFEWVARHALRVLWLVLLAGLAAIALRGRTPWQAGLAFVAAAAAVALGAGLMVDASADRRVNRTTAVLVADVVPANGDIRVELGNLPRWQAMLSTTGGVALVAAVGLGWFARRRAAAGWRSDVWRGASVALGGAGLLAQRGGAILFFAVMALGILWLLLARAAAVVVEHWRARRGSPDAGGAGGPASVVNLLVIGGVLIASVGAAASLRAAEPAKAISSGPALQSLVQQWQVRDHRLYAEVTFTVRGSPGDSVRLLDAPAVLTEFVADGARVAPMRVGSALRYDVYLERTGQLTGRAKFELPVSDYSAGIPILTAAAAVQRISITLEEGGWEFQSPRAAEVAPASGLGANRSGATLVLGPSGTPIVELRPQRRDASAEATRFVADVATLYVPSPGVVNGFARVNVRPIQGKVSALEVTVPEGFFVGEVAGQPVGSWRYDPLHRRLRVVVEPAAAEPFGFTVEFQRAASSPPYELTLQPLRVQGAEEDTGLLGLAFGGDAQPEAVRPQAATRVAIEDFSAELVPHDRAGRVVAVIQQAFRYRSAEAAVGLRVTAVEPEVRVASRQLLSLGDDRIVLAADLAVSITRVGIFQLSVVVPPGLELESVSGAALSHWTETRDGDRQVVTLHLNGRTIGEQAFALTLIGAAPAAGRPWVVPNVVVREAVRHTGELQVVPEKGLRLRTLERRSASELDPRILGTTRSGALAFRLLEPNWRLTLGVDAVDPWVTVQALQEITAREGQTLTRLALRYRIENAAIKQVRLALPALSEEEAKTLRATGTAVSDIVALPGNPGQWEVRFQRGVVGETTVEIEYQGRAAIGAASWSVAPVRFEGARQVTQYVAIRGAGRLEIEPTAAPRGWQRVDWAVVPAVLQDRADRSMPALAYRVADPEGPLPLRVRRNELAEALKLRVTRGRLATVVSPHGPTLTAVQLELEVVEKSTLRMRLPAGARIVSAFVNGESAPVVRDGGDTLFAVVPSTAQERTGMVRVVYTVTEGERSEFALVAPRLNVPLENVTWRVVLPPRYELSHYRGALQLRTEALASGYGLPEYESLVVAKRAEEARQATQAIERANALLQRGQQQLAAEVLSRAANTATLDEASNEDARVQLRAVRTQQTVVGLTTRRQRLYLDHSAEGGRNEQIEHAASVNPLIRGKLEFDGQKLDQFLAGNTVEENTALQGIAARLVDQQLASTAAPGAIDVTLPQRARVLTFERRLQVDGEVPLELRLTVQPVRENAPLLSLALLVGLAAVGTVAWARAGRSSPQSAPLG